jgi:hypothetical protein
MFLEGSSQSKNGLEIFKPSMLGDLSRKQDGVLVLKSENPDAIEKDF